MFELNNFIKKIFSNEDKYSSYDRNGKYLKVVYENSKIKKEISEWIKFLGIDNFSLVLLDIGFNNDDTIYLYEKNNNLEYYYSVNEDGINKSNFIKLSYGAFMDRGSTIDVWNGNNYKNYDFDNKENNLRLSISKKKISSDLSYNRSFYSSMAMFVVKNRDYKFQFYVYEISKDDSKVVELDNEDKLEEYLVNLEFPVNIIDVYKNIVSICNIDVSKYQIFKIDIVPSEVGKKADMLELIYGQFRQINITRDGKRICLNENDVWSYEMVDNDSLVKLSIDYSNSGVSYKVISNNNEEMDDYMRFLLEYDISDAKSKVDDVKKLVKRMFNKKMGE